MLITLLLALICILLIKKIPSNSRKTTMTNSHHTAFACCFPKPSNFKAILKVETTMSMFLSH